MSLWKSNDRRDGNEPPIVERLRAMGATVAPISGRDVPDLAVGWKGATYLAEVKQPKGKLKPGQEKFIRLWRGSKVAVLRTPEEAGAWLLSLRPTPPVVERVATSWDGPARIRVDEMDDPSEFR